MDETLAGGDRPVQALHGALLLEWGGVAANREFSRIMQLMLQSEFDTVVGSSAGAGSGAIGSLDAVEHHPQGVAVWPRVAATRVESRKSPWSETGASIVRRGTTGGCCRRKGGGVSDTFGGILEFLDPY